MQLITIVIFIFISLFFTSPVLAGESSVNVSVSNHTGNSTSTSYTSEGKTDVYINQTGEGTSSVKVNGKEWKLEGPGEIKVNEGTETVENTPNPSPTDTASPSATVAPTEVDSAEVKNFLEKIEDKIEEIRETIQEFFENIF